LWKSLKKENSGKNEEDNEEEHVEQLSKLTEEGILNAFYVVRNGFRQ